jgi:hypothetical protein
MDVLEARHSIIGHAISDVLRGEPGSRCGAARSNPVETGVALPRLCLSPLVVTREARVSRPTGPA